VKLKIGIIGREYIYGYFQAGPYPGFPKYRGPNMIRGFGGILPLRFLEFS